MSFDQSGARSFIADRWTADLVDQISHYITIPALSPAFDDSWVENGHIAAAVDHIESWFRTRPVAGATVEVQELPGRTPLIIVEVPPFGAGSDTDDSVVLYGHLDKQPEMLPWGEGLAPWSPVRRGDRLYGRGGADDGYSAYAALTAIEAVQQHGGSHGRLFVLIEASEESGSPDLESHIEHLAARLGTVGLVIALDSGCADYQRVWLTASLRGLVGGTLEATITTEGVHSGSAGGVVPSTFRIIRQLLDRIEDSSTGQVLVSAANVEIPDHRQIEAADVAGVVGDSLDDSYPFVSGASRCNTDPVEALLAKTWRPSLSYVGADGLPPIASAGNVLRPTTALKLSLRIPPTADPAAVEQQLGELLEANPPYGAHVSFTPDVSGVGWNAPPLAPWLSDALEAASQAEFGHSFQVYGEGGSIPFMGMLGERFPAAQFVITGVLGPGSNAHGPNEYLHVAYAEGITAAVATVLDRHATARA